MRIVIRRDNLAFGLYIIATLTVAATAWRPVANVEVSDWLFGGSMIAAILLSPGALVRAVVALPRLAIVGAAALVLGTAVSLHASAFPALSLGILARFIFLIIFWLALGLVTLPTYNRIRVAVQAWTASAAIVGYTGVLEVLFHVHLFGAPNFSYVGRASGLTLHPNDLGAVCSFAFAPAASLLISSTRTTSIIARVLVMAGILAGILVSGSVDGYIVTLVTGVGWLATLRSRRRTAWIVVAAASAMVLLLASLAPAIHIRSPLQRIAQVTAANPTASLGTRLQLASETLHVISQHPLVGVGLDPASEQKYVPFYPENMLLVAWLGAGALGLVGVLLIAVAIGLRAIWIFGADELARSVSLSYIGFLIYAQASPLLQQRFAWMPAAMIIALCPIVARNDVAVKEERSPQAYPSAVSV
ncbi:MAG: O-antigen ligase family protein [Candidatus Dormibacterales bacterium]